jgi:hypothetical protein
MSEERMGYDYEDDGETDDLAHEGTAAARKLTGIAEDLRGTLEEFDQWLYRNRHTLNEIDNWAKLANELRQTAESAEQAYRAAEVDRQARVEAEALTRSVLRDFTRLREALREKGAPSDLAAMIAWINSYDFEG